MKRFCARVGLSVSRVATQAGLPKQTLFNWCSGTKPRWHPRLPKDLERLSRALGLGEKELDEMLLAAGCICAVDTPAFEETNMETLTLPRGWFRAGSHPAQYDMGIDPAIQHQGRRVALIRSRTTTADGFGTLMQSCRPGAFLDHRVRLTATLRTEDIGEWAGLWFRIDGPDDESLNFDNMQDRALKGTNGWADHSVVLDVDKKAVGIAFGVLLSGTGKVWIANFRMEQVGLDVPSTNLKCERLVPEAPVNLDFAA
ncbi:MAG: helix-turn-helix domain-containing protein [Planctomycetes bacterium]|nr:helix-turn-helix domain-containing protein [Planctomycetota bacterium]